MERSLQDRESKLDLLECELLSFYDEFTEQSACVLFAMQALVSALVSAEGAEQQSTTGAMFWVQRLNDRTLDLEQRLRDIRQQVHDVPRS